jgi:hypothetical protein
MPFKSKAQVRQCYALKEKGEAGTWDCDEWAKETNDIKKLPEKVKKGKGKGKMEARDKFIKFLGEITLPQTKTFIEGITKAFNVCFESYPATEETPDEGGNEDPGFDTKGGTGASAMNEDAEEQLDTIEKQKALLAEKEDLAKKELELKKATAQVSGEEAELKKGEGEQAKVIAGEQAELV